MRTKRSKDTRLLDKFSKQKDALAAESRIQKPINPHTADDDCALSSDKEEEEDDLKARDSHSCVVLTFETKHL